MQQNFHLSFSVSVTQVWVWLKETMMYVLHFSIDWGHRLHKCLGQVWYFNLFLVRGCWTFAQSIHRATALPRYLMVNFHCSVWKQKCQPKTKSSKMTLKYDCLQSKITFIYFYPESSNEHRKKKKKNMPNTKRAEWHLKSPLFSPLKSNPNCLIYQSTKA